MCVCMCVHVCVCVCRYGYTWLWLAILADVGTMILVTLNGASVLRWEPGRGGSESALEVEG